MDTVSIIETSKQIQGNTMYKFIDLLQKQHKSNTLVGNIHVFSSSYTLLHMI